MVREEGFEPPAASVFAIGVFTEVGQMAFIIVFSLLK
tara:strand:+ start:1175 stop:1285 length:111 start_codon:yes stop_codon:yes gene_type:complete